MVADPAAPAVEMMPTLDAFKCDLLPIDKNEVWEVTYMNMMGAFMFTLFILFVTGKKTSVPDLGSWGIVGICLNLWALCNVDWYTAPSFNPALAVGGSIFQYWQWDYANKDLMLFYMPWYMIGSCLGGVLSGMFYHYLASLFPDRDQEENITKAGVRDSINDDH